MSVTNQRFSMLVMLSVFSVITLVTYSTNGQTTGPPNDMFASATVISGNAGQSEGSVFGATLEPTEPGSCSTCKTVWYRWTAPANLSMTYELGPSSFPFPPANLSDTVLGVYMGSDVGSLTMLTWNDDISAERGNRHSRVTFIANAGQTYNIRVYGGSGTEGLFRLRWEINGAESWKQFNFDGCSASEGHKSDFAIFRPSDGSWWLNSDLAPFKTLAWGLPDDIRVPGDYFGDGCSDVAIFRPSDGNWWILDLPTGNPAVAHWGVPGDVPVRGDFDGDDKADIAIYRGGEPGGVNQFWILNSSDGSVRVDSVDFEVWYPTWASPVVADYDGDGKTDLAVKTEDWTGPLTVIVKRSSDLSYAYYGINWGDLVNGDFDHDGKSDVAYRSMHNPEMIYAFYVYGSSNGWAAYRWGIDGDIPVSGDYGGSTGSDLCVWRPSDGNLYCYDPIGQSNWQYKWGTNGDKPIATVYQPVF